MIEHFAIPFCEAYAKLANWIQTLHCRSREDIPKQLNDRKLSDGYTYAVCNDGLAPIVAQLEHLGFDRALTDRAKLLCGHLAIPQGRTWTAESVGDRLVDIRRGIGEELKKHKFAYLQPPCDQYFAQEKLFGESIYQNFPSARTDIKEAGNSLACGLWTAGVFHLMRVAEYGLRALCYDRRIRLPKNRPIDLATWEDLLKELEAVELKIQGYLKTLAREAQFSFYHGAMMELKRFKNLYRNKVMHTRESYDEHQAVGAFHHVKAFMDILATRIGEGKRTPEIWKGAKWHEA